MTSLLFIFTLFASLGYPFNAIPGYADLKKPPLRDIACDRNKDSVRFRFSGIDFVLHSSRDLESPPKVFLKRNQSVIASFKLSSIYFDPISCKIESFDADKNGFADLFVAYAFGPSGRNTSIQVIDAFYFLNDSTFKFVELASFYGDFELFRDFNCDGKFEYACIKWDNDGSSTGRDVTNVFSIIGGEYKNISSDTPGFPVVSEQSPKGQAKLLKPIPENSNWYMDAPSVLQR